MILSHPQSRSMHALSFPPCMAALISWSATTLRMPHRGFPTLRQVSMASMLLGGHTGAHLVAPFHSCPLRHLPTLTPAISSPGPGCGEIHVVFSLSGHVVFMLSFPYYLSYLVMWSFPYYLSYLVMWSFPYYLSYLVMWSSCGLHVVFSLSGHVDSCGLHVVFSCGLFLFFMWIHVVFSLSGYSHVACRFWR
jgi:hypothetical protein